MIETYFGANLLSSFPAFISALIIGIAFGWCLEQAGFGSSRRLSGIFYFRDMAVLKVMFSAVITAALGLLILFNLGLISPESIYFPETFWGAQIIGGLLFGVGFVIGGWCPGTAAVGAVSGKFDALIFLFGAGLGSMAFSESFDMIKPYYLMGASGVRFVYDDLGLPVGQFALLLTLVAIAAFWISELIETKFDFALAAQRSKGLWVFSLAILIVASGISVLPARSVMGTATTALSGLPEVYEAISRAEDHIEPVDLARELVAGKSKIICVDVRTLEEYHEWHIPGARHFPLESVAAGLNKYKNYDRIVLYSNGTVHPAQMWVVLRLKGFRNVFVLADGLKGLFETVLKPAVLRTEALSEAQQREIEQWRSYFLSSGQTVGSAAMPDFSGVMNKAKNWSLSPLVDVEWLESNLDRVRIIDTRPQPEYNSGHIDGAISLNIENLRGNVGGMPSMLLPPEMIAKVLSLAGIRPDDKIVIVDDKIRNATLLAAALSKVGHAELTILNGGFNAWRAAAKPVSRSLRSLPTSDYQPVEGADAFIIDTEELYEKALAKKVRIVDARPSEQYSGQEVTEARGGHIPGALNRPVTQDLMAVNESEFRPAEELKNDYNALLGTGSNGNDEIVANCRTGHSASQAWYVMNRILGYKNVRLYDGSWTIWAADERLPVEK